ncbi:uncharacterized protein LOC116191916 isoform X2 [Punica granatum]|uniref:Uncharacterized protein LOC116191916 isoform X2 n=1 Tax=Punica granatum TaxID=22663 RepID=A0A6P8C109_PUNGR|nr:uncharacterized protein LOC116191916 isoform X2 [Punica granatum]
MGSGGSKASSSSGRRDRSKGKARVFQSSCLGSLSGSRRGPDNADQVYEPCDKDGDDYTQRANQDEADTDQLKTASNRKGEVGSLSETAGVSSNAELQEWDRSSIMSDTASRAGSSSVRASINRQLNPSSRFFSRFSFNRGNVSFRLSRATSLGSSRDYHVSPTNLTRSDDEEDLHFHGAPSSGLFDINESRQGSDSLHSSRVNRDPTRFIDGALGNRWSSSLASEPSDNLGANLTISSTSDVDRDVDNARAAVDMNFRNPRLLPEHGYVESGPSDRRAGAREPVERNVRFSRTLSVGRLRDRVLRRSSLSEFTYCPVQREGEASDEGQGTEREGLGVETRTSAAESNAASLQPTSGYSPAGLSDSLFSDQYHEADTSRSREARYRDLLEHRSDFLERRRRIRSQVRALQRLESRFENLSGHERSCILSGQHRTGRCTCRNGNRGANSNDDTNARASISRIVMLAEALFEQSVVLSSRPSVSSIGSVPAPNEVVDSLPTKLYSKLQTQKTEEAAQCYICLVEYEEGESVRILPCHHEFHRACIDKWLKEIHRVCPLCRGDICRSGSFSAENEV